MTELELVYQEGLEDGYALAVLDRDREKEKARKFANWRKAERERLNCPWPTLDEEQKEAA